MLQTIMNTSDSALLALLHLLKAAGYEFTTITPLSHAHVNARPVNQWARPHNPFNAESKLQSLRDVFGWSRPFQQHSFDPEIFVLMEQACILQAFEDGWRSVMRVSSVNVAANGGNKPGILLFLHSAFPTQEADAVFFGPDTYRYLHAISNTIQSHSLSKVKRAVDIGCGAGPGAVMTALQFPSAEMYAIDINPLALSITQTNAAFAGTANLQAKHSDLLKDIDGQFDFIIANPPFLLDSAKRAYRHGGGHYGEGFSLDIVKAALPRLNVGGTLLLYTGVAIVDGFDAFQHAVELELAGTKRKVTWHYRETDPDIFGEELLLAPYSEVDRIAAITLCVQLQA